MSEFDFDAEYGVNLDLIISRSDQYILAGDLATLVKMNGLISVGGCLKSMELDNLQRMIQFIEDTWEEEDPSDDTCHGELLLLSMIMSHAEGDHIQYDMDEHMKRMHQTLTFIMLERLYRMGLIELKRENLTYDSSGANLLVAKATQKGIDFKDELGE